LNVHVIHGPNLNLLGQREREVYGADTLESINALLASEAKPLGIVLTAFQSNSEGELVTALHAANDSADAVIINPAAYTHTSVALRDAVAAMSIPVVEVHLSNIYAREEFRHHSYIAPVAAGQIAGFGKHSYRLALHAVKGLVES
jgi:3-dehydroquinate dehydratase II